MSLEYIFPDHSKRNRKIAIAVECVAAALATGLLVWTIWYYRDPSAVIPPAAQEQGDGFAAQRKGWLEQPNTGEALSVTQLEDRKQFVSQPSATSTQRLTPEQIKSRQAWVDNI